MKTISGDILSIEHGYIMHQVNCRGVMGAGLAKQIKLAYPDVYNAYRRMCSAAKDAESLLGLALVVQATETLHVVNLFGQQNFGTHLQQTNYAAVRAGLYNFSDHRKNANKDWPVYIPMGMGCGLAGGNWAVVSKIIEDTVPDAIIVQFRKGIWA